MAMHPITSAYAETLEMLNVFLHLYELTFAYLYDNDIWSYLICGRMLFLSSLFGLVKNSWLDYTTTPKSFAIRISVEISTIYKCTNLEKMSGYE